GHVSDGCTMSPDLDFRDCCEMHDMIIRFNQCDRKHADTLLKKCIRQKKRRKIFKLLFKPVAYIYYLGVRMQARFGIGGTIVIAGSVIMSVIFIVYASP
ncbi:MAG: phospholipase, partial [Gammaproteobacteria bacterium]|nr:phospholipase [Gammaproteobacteria bacterium]